MLNRQRVVASVLSLCWLLPLSAAAGQTATQPTRPFRGLFGGGIPAPGQTRHELSVVFSLGSGYDQDLSDQPEVLVPDAEGVQQSGYVGLAQAQLKYVRASAKRSLSANGSLNTATYEGASESFPISGSAGVEGELQVGRSTRLTASVGGANSAYYGVGAFDGLRPVVGSDTPGVGTDYALLSRRNWTYDAAAKINQKVGRRSSLSGDYRVFLRQFADMDADSTTSNDATFQHAATVSFNRNLTSSFGLGASYNFQHGEYENPNEATRPYSNSAISASLQYERRLSRSRTLALGGGAGAAYIKSVDGGPDETRQTWQPSGQANVRLDLGRSWVLAGDYARSLSPLDGVADETYFSDTGSLSIEGQLARSVGLVASLALARGAAPNTLEESSYTSYTGSLSATYNLTQLLFVSAGYVYYRYQFSGEADLVSGIPPGYERQGFRLSISTFVPLFGSFGTAR